MLLIHSDLLTLLGLQTKSYIPPRYPYASLFLRVSPFPIHHEVLTLSTNIPKPFTSSENQLLKQRRKKTGPQHGADFKRIPLYMYHKRLIFGFHNCYCQDDSDAFANFLLASLGIKMGCFISMIC